MVTYRRAYFGALLCWSSLPWLPLCSSLSSQSSRGIQKQAVASSKTYEQQLLQQNNLPTLQQQLLPTYTTIPVTQRRDIPTVIRQDTPPPSPSSSSESNSTVECLDPTVVYNEMASQSDSSGFRTVVYFVNWVSYCQFAL
jgi:hypothetical protein